MSRRADSFARAGNSNFAGDVTIKSGAVIRSLDGGVGHLPAQDGARRRNSRRVGQLVNIAGRESERCVHRIYDGFTSVQAPGAWYKTSRAPLLLNRPYEGQYTEAGRDSLTLNRR